MKAEMNCPAASCGASKNIDENLSQRRRFYETKEDLLELVMPFYKTGLVPSLQ